MGQRSQIYVRYNDREKKGLIANYYGWNFGTRMISRAKAGIEHILESLKYDWYYESKSNVTKLSRVLDINFDYRDVAISADIIAEYVEEFADTPFREYVFRHQDNNDGKLFIDIDNGTIKYAFLDRSANLDNIMDASAYIIWDCGADWQTEEDPDDVATCLANITYINEHVTLMTAEELDEFMSYDYGYQRDHPLITFKTVNCDGEEREFSFNSVDEIRCNWWADTGTTLPGREDAVIAATYDGHDLKKATMVETFDDIVCRLGLDSIIDLDSIMTRGFLDNNFWND